MNTICPDCYMTPGYQAPPLCDYLRRRGWRCKVCLRCGSETYVYDGRPYPQSAQGGERS